MSWYGLRIGVGLILFTLAGPAHAFAGPIKLALHHMSQTGSIMWDGGGDVASSNELVAGNASGLYSSLGLSSPSDLGVLLTLTGPAITINKVAILLSYDDGIAGTFSTCSGCLTIRDALDPAHLDLSQTLPVNSSHHGGALLDNPVIAFAAALQTPIYPALGHNGDVYRLSKVEADRMSGILSTFGPDHLVVGLAVDSVRIGNPIPGYQGIEEYSIVPEPGTWLLLGGGLALFGVRRWRAAC